MGTNCTEEMLTCLESLGLASNSEGEGLAVSIAGKDILIDEALIWGIASGIAGVGSGGWAVAAGFTASFVAGLISQNDVVDEVLDRDRGLFQSPSSNQLPLPHPESTKAWTLSISEGELSSLLPNHPDFTDVLWESIGNIYAHYGVRDMVYMMSQQGGTPIPGIDQLITSIVEHSTSDEYSLIAPQLENLELLANIPELLEAITYLSIDEGSTITIEGSLLDRAIENPDILPDFAESELATVVLGQIFRSDDLRTILADSILNIIDDPSNPLDQAIQTSIDRLIAEDALITDTFTESIYTSVRDRLATEGLITIPSGDLGIIPITPGQQKLMISSLPGKNAGTSAEVTENPLVTMQAQLETLQTDVSAIHSEKLVAMETEIDQTQEYSATNKQDILQLLTQMHMLDGSISSMKDDFRRLEGQIRVVAAAQRVAEHDKPERQAENMI